MQVATALLQRAAELGDDDAENDPAGGFMQDKTGLEQPIRDSPEEMSKESTCFSQPKSVMIEQCVLLGSHSVSRYASLDVF